MPVPLSGQPMVQIFLARRKRRLELGQQVLLDPGESEHGSPRAPSRGFDYRGQRFCKLVQVFS
jgi:hypothetical protein